MDRDAIQRLIEANYAARARGDFEATRRCFSEHPRFEVAGSPQASAVTCRVEGQAPFESVLRAMMSAWEWRDHTLVSTLIDGNRAAVRWRARLRHAPTGQTVETEAVDLLTVENGRIASFVEFCDTALAQRIMG